MCDEVSADLTAKRISREMHNSATRNTGALIVSQMKRVPHQKGELGVSGIMRYEAVIGTTATFLISKCQRPLALCLISGRM
mmetsp:Transcript_34461/g.46560  ORF Transcript_34461/g.46560 Transcript_34461/m.46560 type:complete len:81 (-) Transcript_34461:335-577(-)